MINTRHGLLASRRTLGTATISTPYLQTTQHCRHNKANRFQQRTSATKLVPQNLPSQTADTYRTTFKDFETFSRISCAIDFITHYVSNAIIGLFLFVCFFVRTITQKTNDPKVFKIGMGNDLGIDYSTYGMILGQRSKVKVRVN